MKNAKKIKKLIKHPRDFFQDFFRKRTGSVDLDTYGSYFNSPNGQQIQFQDTVNLTFEDFIFFLQTKKIPSAFYTSKKLMKPYLFALEDNKDDILANIGLFCAMHGFKLTCSSNKNKNKRIISSVPMLFDFFKSSNVGVIQMSSLSCKNEIKFGTHFWTEHKEYYDAPSANLVARRLWKSNKSSADIFKEKSTLDFSQTLPHPHVQEVTFPIDVVFTWVNADDVKWQKLYNKYMPKKTSDASTLSRFHSRDELKYALRSWEKYAPFVRKFFIVSNCAAPEWLNFENDRIEWVSHESILPPSALPTFSSHAIETSLHKIKDLSNYFIYSNDDFLLTRMANSEDFFYPNGIAKVRLENYGMVNGEVDESHPDYLNAARNSNMLIEKDFKRSTTQLVTHSPQPLRKDILVELENKYSKHFRNTYLSKFRSVNDIAVTGYLHANYAILTGRAIHDKTPVLLIQQNHNFKARFDKLLSDKEKNPSALPLSVCVNDGNDSHLNLAWNNSITNFLNVFFLHKSAMEH